MIYVDASMQSLPLLIMFQEIATLETYLSKSFFSIHLSELVIVLVLV